MQVTNNFDCSVHLKMSLREGGDIEAHIVATTVYDKATDAKTSVQVPLSDEALAMLKEIGIAEIERVKPDIGVKLLGAVAKSMEVGKAMGEVK